MKDVDKAIAEGLKVVSRLRADVRRADLIATLGVEAPGVYQAAFRGAFSKLVPARLRKHVNAVMFADKDLIAELVRVRKHLSPKWREAVEISCEVDRQFAIEQVMEG
jgi:hypothetical protein